MNVNTEFCIIFIAACIILIHNPRVSAKVIYIPAALFLALTYSFFATRSLGYSFTKPLQQVTLLLCFSFCYFVIFDIYQNSISILFHKYIKASFWVSLIGIAQFVVYFVTGVNNLFILPSITGEVAPRILRVTSIVHEPGNLAALLLPPLVYYVYTPREKQISYSKVQFIIILSAFLLTFSNAGYFIFGLSLLYHIYKGSWKKKLKLGILILLPTVILIFSSDKLQSLLGNQRAVSSISTTFSGIRNIQPEVYEAMGLSSYALLSNLYVSLNAPYRLLGTGIGTQEQNYFSVYHSTYAKYGQNAQDGYSLFNRLFSEFGMFGLLLLSWFIVKNSNRNNAINMAVLFLLLQLLIRGGHYTLYGTVFFFFMYYYSNKKHSIKDLSNANTNDNN